MNDIKFKHENKTKDAFAKKLAFQAAYEFALKYLNSEGYKLRFLNKKWMEMPSGHELDNLFFEGPITALQGKTFAPEIEEPIDNIRKIQYTLAPDKIKEVELRDYKGFEDNAAYLSSLDRFIIGHNNQPSEEILGYYTNIPNPRLLFNPYLSVLFHEFGHWADDAVKTTVFSDNYPDGVLLPFLTYSNRIPALRLNKELNALAKARINRPTRFKLIILTPNTELFGDTHDALPAESYADLFLFRALLDWYGIYDSTKPDNPFTKEHLDRFKTLRIPSRLLTLFSDDDIIWIMNNVADNSSTPRVQDEFDLNKHNKTTYA